MMIALTAKKPVEPFDNDQGAQYQEGDQVGAQVREGRVQERRGEDADQSVHRSRHQAECHEAVAGRYIEQLQRDHEDAPGRRLS